MKACCPFCRTWNATYTFRALPVPFQGPFWCDECDTKLAVDGFYHCEACGGTLLLTIPRGQSLYGLRYRLLKALFAATLITGLVAALRMSIPQDVLIYIAVAIMVAALILWLFRLPLLRLVSLPSRKYARPAPDAPVLLCGHCGQETSLDNT